MATLKSGLILGENEHLVVELEAELWATSSNPISLLIGNIVKFLNLLIGFKRKGYVVITDLRVVEIIQFKALGISTRVV